MNPRGLRLGRREKKADPRTLRFEKYLVADIPVAPASVSYEHGMSNWGMLLNDSLGDCTIAAVAHAIQVWSANASKIAPITDAEVLEYYEKWDGYVNNDPSTDNGGVPLTVLTDWQKQGFAGYPLTAFATVNTWHRQQIKQAIFLFGGIYIGLNVPAYVMNDPQPSTVWDNQTADRDIVGGHAVWVTGFSGNLINFISWGQNYSMTQSFWRNFVDEAFALISPTWFSSTGGAPNGFDLAQLEADLAQIK